MKTTFEGMVLEGQELAEILNDSQLGLAGHPLNPMIGKVSFVVMASQSVVCEILTGDDHAVVDFSRPIDPETYVVEKGYIAALRKTRDQLWGVVALRAKLENDPKLVSKLVDLYKG